MEKIRITFLGTSNAIPTKEKNHTSILLSYKGENILIDCGEGTQRQFKFAGISPHKITKILLTHWHGDHILGLPGLFQTLAMNEFSKELHVYGPKGTSNHISQLISLFRIKIRIKTHEVEGKFFSNEDFFLEAMQMSHDIPCLAYSFTIPQKLRINKEKIEKLKLPNSPLIKNLKEGKDIEINGKKIKASNVTYKEKGRKVSLILDTSPNANTLKLAKESDLVISEATFSINEKEIAKEHKHLTSKDSAEIAKKSKSKKLILTHLSERYHHNPKIILDEARKTFKNTTLAKDFDTLEI